MNNTAVSLGCSWTYGYGIDSNETYSAHLQNLCSKYKFINAGHCGADIDYAIFSGTKLIENYSPKLIIFQLTSFDRLTLGTDGFENFLKSSVAVDDETKIYYESQKDENLRVIGINNGAKTKYTPGSYIASKKDRNEEIELSNMKKVNFKKYTNFLEVLYENVVYSEYEFNKKINNLYLFKEYLKQKQIKSLWFNWIKPHDSNFFKKFFVNDNYIDISVTEWLLEKYPSNDFYIDNGYHISDAGNNIIARDYILPRLKELI